MISNVLTLVFGLHLAGKIGALTACSYLGLLVGPPIFGGLSSLLGELRWALLVDAILMFLISPLAGLAFKDVDYPRLLNVSFSTVFKVDGDEDTVIVSPPGEREVELERVRLM